MQVAQFAADQREHVVRADGGYRAFVPPSLPPRLDLTADLARRLSAADRAIGELAGMGRSMPNPHLMSRALMRREAVLSSRIEGTQASLSDLVLYEAAPSPATDNTDVREVHNYLRALDHVLDKQRRLPLSISLLREAHQILLDGVRGNYATPGDCRTSQNWVGSASAVIDSATYVPPPPEALWECLGAFEQYLHADRSLPPLLDIAAIHYQFEAIHPFLDGNGRVGRLLVVLLLVQWGLLPALLLDLSAYIERRRDRYYDGLLRVSTDGDWPGWLSFFLEVVEHQSRDAINRARRMYDLRERMRADVATARSSGLPTRLVDALFDTPVLTIAQAQRLLDVTHRAAAQNIDKLVALGILREVPPVGRRRLFYASEIMHVVDEERVP